MKKMIFGALVATFAVSFAQAQSGAVTMRAGAHTCSEYENAIRQHGKVTVKYSFAARSFYSSTDACRWNENPVSLHVKGKNGSCLLRWACEYDRQNDK